MRQNVITTLISRCPMRSTISSVVAVDAEEEIADRVVDLGNNPPVHYS